MHIVIADDLTGAAEIAGVGLSRGLKSVVTTTVNGAVDCDLWCLATDTRSSKNEAAGLTTGIYSRQLLALQPNIFYKKVDSVLRGNVMPECEAFAGAQGLDKAIIVPANPSLNRFIRDGIYYIGDIPLAEANLIRNAKGSSRLLDMINPAYRERTKIIKSPSEMEDPGLYIGEVAAYSDLFKWASLLKEPVALCGGSDFFDALLEVQFMGSQNGNGREIPFGKRQLFILGSAARQHESTLRQETEDQAVVSNMPLEIFASSTFHPEVLKEWIAAIRRIFDVSNRVVITMHHHNLPYEERPHLKLVLGELVKAILQEIIIDELFVEGGATSYAILNKLQVNQLVPVQNLARGVTRMEIDNYKLMKMTVKPGSYQWPESVWPRLKDLQLLPKLNS